MGFHVRQKKILRLYLALEYKLKLIIVLLLWFKELLYYLAYRAINITYIKLLTADVETRLVFILSNCLDFELDKNYDIPQNGDQHLQIYKFKQRIIDILGIILYPSKVF